MKGLSWLAWAALAVLAAFCLGTIALQSGRIIIDEEGRTSLDRVWAGGDCVLGGEDLTVSAVAMGRDAAESINLALAAARQPAVAVA